MRQVSIHPTSPSFSFLAGIEGGGCHAFFAELFLLSQCVPPTCALQQLTLFPKFYSCNQPKAGDYNTYICLGTSKAWLIFVWWANQRLSSHKRRSFNFLRKNTKLWGHQWNNFPHWRYVAKWGPQIKPCWQDNHFRAGIVNVAPRSTPILGLSVPTSYAHPTTNMEPVFLKNIPILRCTRSGHHLLNHLVKSWQWEK
jgi:hypothetical protein